MKRRLAVALTLGAATLCSFAGTLYVPNFSFESPSTDFVDPRIDSWQKEPQPGTFDTNVFGAWDNLAGVFVNAPSTNADHIDNCNGAQLAYVFAYPQAGIFQDYDSTDWSNATPTHAFNASFVPGKSYHLTVALTSSREEELNPGSTILLGLYYRDGTNMVTVASTTVTYDTTVFTNITHLVDFHVNVPTVQTNDVWAGKHIGIQIMSTVDPFLLGGVWDVDNVRLTETIDVPNFSFESPATDFVDPRIDSWQKEPQPGTFDTNVFGAWDNLAGLFANPPSTNADHIDNCDGNQLAYVFSYPQVGFFQGFDSLDWSNTVPTHAFNATYTAGKTYTLTAAFTSSSEEPLTPGATLQTSLYYLDPSSNRIPVAATTITYDTNVFTNLNHLVDFHVTVPEVHPTDPWAGKKIGVEFMSTVSPFLIGGVWDVDNVRLAETVATEVVNPVNANGVFTFTLLGEPGSVVNILSSTNVAQLLGSWPVFATVTNVSGSATITDPATNSHRFYRARGM